MMQMILILIKNKTNLYLSKDRNYILIKNMKVIFIFSIFFYKIFAFTISTKIINHTNAINLLVAYEMRMIKYEASNNTNRNNLQKYIKVKHQESFDEIRNDKVLLSTLCTVNRKNSLPEPIYLILNQGNCVNMIPLWNIYNSEIVALVSPREALLESCNKYYFPENIANENELYNIYKYSKIIKCNKLLEI